MEADIKYWFDKADQMLDSVPRYMLGNLVVSRDIAQAFFARYLIVQEGSRSRENVDWMNLKAGIRIPYSNDENDDEYNRALAEWFFWNKNKRGSFSGDMAHIFKQFDAVTKNPEWLPYVEAGIEPDERVTELIINGIDPQLAATALS